LALQLLEVFGSVPVPEKNGGAKKCEDRVLKI
jgi:hypothetical protein